MPFLFFIQKILLDLKGDKVIFVQLPLHEWNSSIPLGRLKKKVTFIFLLCVLWCFLAGRRYEQPEQGQDCFGSAWLCSAFAVE